MKLTNLLICFLVVIINLAVWLYINKPYHPVNSHYPLNGMCFNPFQKNQTPYDGVAFNAQDMEKDLAVLSDKTKTVRVYTATNGMDQLPKLAEKFGLNIVLTAWLDSRAVSNNNQTEVNSAIQLTGRNRNIKRLLIGNETQLHKSVPREELITYLDEARRRLKTPVSTAESWDYWLNNPDLADHVDFIAIHVLPYWVGIPIEEAADYVLGKYWALKERFPEKKIIITEAGWPSEGPQRGSAVPSLINQAMFIRSFVRLAKTHHIDYMIMEAFDQPWKNTTEGRTGEHWGIMNADRESKFPMHGPVLSDPNWKYWTVSAILFGLLAAMLFTYRRHQTRFIVRLFVVILIQIMVSLGLGLVREITDEYLTPAEIVFWCAVIIGQFLLALVFLTDAREITDVVGKKPLAKKFTPSKNGNTATSLFVSLHVPCCKEPPELVIETLNSLAQLNYPNFEVLVLDNNTPDPALWKPVEEHCQKLGPRFRFFTLGKHPGFKAGALNFAITVVDPRTEIIGVLDADYVVDPSWLSASIPYFSDPDVSVVQAPQEHRDWQNNIYHRMENDEYSGFFRIGMVQRNEDNAIIQHGTMTLMRKSTLCDTGGWAEWCICEDAELGLRMLNVGKHLVYIDHPMGWGLVPDSYEAYAKQRFRWAYGGMRIMRRYGKELLGFKGKLNFKQRLNFVMGWIPWLGDALHLVFTFCAISWNIVLMYDPVFTDFPEPVLLYPLIILFFVRLTTIMWTYRVRVPINKRRTFLAMLAGGSLTHKIAKAVFQGIFTSSLPFYRTPKNRSDHALFKALNFVREEILLTMILVFSAVWIFTVFGHKNFQAVLWGITNIIQTVPYVAAIVVSVVSVYAKESTKT